MHFGHQGAGGIEHFQTALIGFLPDSLRNTVSAKNHNNVIWHFSQLIHKNSTPVAQRVYHKFIVYHFVTYIDWGSEHIQRTVHNINGAINPSTKTTRVGKVNFRR